MADGSDSANQPTSVAAANDSHYGSGSKGGQFAPKGQDGASSPSAVAQEFANRRRYGGLQGTARTGDAADTTKYVEPPANLTRGTMKRGGNNDPLAVNQLQQVLADLKIGNVTPDGTFGTQTELAVKAAQMKLGLKPTGRAGVSLVRRLLDAHRLSPCVGGGAVAAAAADVNAGHTGAMVALVPTEDEADRLALEDGEDVDELHCTLLYLGEAADLDDSDREGILAAVAGIAREYKPLTGDGFAISLFNPASDEREPCVVLGLSGADLAGLQHELVNAIEASPEQHQPWIPHITLAYEPAPGIVDEMAHLTGPVTFDRLRVAFGDDVTDYELGSDSPA